jgi:hypothetical protein
MCASIGFLDSILGISDVMTAVAAKCAGGFQKRAEADLGLHTHDIAKLG